MGTSRSVPAAWNLNDPTILDEVLVRDEFRVHLLNMVGSGAKVGSNNVQSIAARTRDNVCAITSAVLFAIAGSSAARDFDVDTGPEVSLDEIGRAHV